MIDPLLLKAAWVPLVVVGYGLLRWRLMVATHDFRTRAGCAADRLAADARVDQQTRSALSTLADRAYRPTTPWLLLVCAAIAVFLPRKTSQHPKSLEGDVAGEVAGLQMKLLLAVISTSPLACVLTFGVLVVSLLVRSLDMVVDAVPGITSRIFAKSVRIAYSHPR